MEANNSRVTCLLCLSYPAKSSQDLGKFEKTREEGDFSRDIGKRKFPLFFHGSHTDCPNQALQLEKQTCPQHVTGNKFFRERQQEYQCVSNLRIRAFSEEPFSRPGI